jgi:N utilization substance protein A
MNYEIDILTDQEETEKRQSEFKIKTKRFIESLEIDEMMAQLLVLEGFSSIKEIDASPLEEITKIDGFDADTAKELKERAKEYLETESKEISNRVKELGIQDDLMNHPGLSLGMLLTLGEKNIKTLADFADLSVDEILGGYDEVKGKRVEFEGILQNFDIIRAEAERLIMSAREKVFNK